MPFYVTRGSYTPQAIAGFLAKPEDRSETVKPLFAAAGAKLVQMFFTTGDTDFLIIAEAPSEKEVLSALLAADAAGTVANMTTSLAFTTAEMKQVMASAGRLAKEYHPPGR
jgi:uncharacterized protein with GYD domain